MDLLMQMGDLTHKLQLASPIPP